MFFHAIYSNELQLKSEHRGLHSTLLDIDITVVYGIFQCELVNFIIREITIHFLYS